MLQADDTTKRAILQYMAGKSNPVGWYPIAVYLGMRGIAIQGNLVALLSDLVEEGLIARASSSQDTQDVYHLTDLGRDYLQRT